MTIFIPIIWICINGHCEFMQQNMYFMTDSECVESTNQQKKKLRDMAEEANGLVGELEGTCVNATIKRLTPYF